MVLRTARKLLAQSGVMILQSDSWQTSTGIEGDEVDQQVERKSEEIWRLRHSKRGRMTKGPRIWNAKMRWREEYEEDISSVSVSGGDLWRCLCIDSRRESSVNYYYYYYYYYLLQLSFHSVATVLTPVQTKHIRINILVHKRNNTKRAQTIQNTVNTSTHITKTPTHYKTHTYTHPHNAQSIHTHTHTLQNPHIHTPTQCTIHTYTHPHITKPIHTHTHTLQNPHIHTPTQCTINAYTHTHTHTLQNPYIHTPTHYKKHTCTHPHVTKQVTSTVQDIHQIKFYVPELIKMVWNRLRAATKYK